MSIIFQPITWFKHQASLYLSGYTANLERCVVQIPECEVPIYIEVEQHNWTEQVLEELKVKVGYSIKRGSLKKTHSLYGYIPMYCFEVYIDRSNIWRVKNLTTSLSFYKMKIHETTYDDRIKYVAINNLKFCDWLRISGSSKIRSSDGVRCIKAESINLDTESTDTIEITPKLFVFDIECEQINSDNVESDDESNDEMDIQEGNLIIQISIVINISNIYLLSIYPVDPKFVTSKKRGIHNIKCEVLSNEKTLLERFFHILIEEDPDIISGYNILQYDWNCIINAAEKYGILNTFLVKSGRCGIPGIVFSSEWQNKAYGKKTFRYPIIEGRCNIDLYQIINRDYSRAVKSEKLNDVAQHFLNEQKLDIDYTIIFLFSKFLRLGNHELDDYFTPYREYHKIVAEVLVTKDLIKPLSKIGKYCVIDSLLVYKLFDKLQVYRTCKETSNVCNIPIDEVYSRGSQHRAFSLFYKESRSRDILLTEAEGFYKMCNDRMGRSYQGAIVLDPKIGLHDNVISLDFNSLYPNIIIDSNICYTTLIDRSKRHLEEAEMISTPEGDFYFSKAYKGMIPSVCKQLIDRRKEVKQQMKESQGLMRDILNCRQLTLKVIANSLYGILGTKFGKHVLSPAAVCITSRGQSLLKQAKEILETEGFKVIYGDTDSTLVKIPSDPRNYISELKQLNPNDIQLKDPLDHYTKSVNTTQIVTIEDYWFKRLIEIGQTLASMVTNRINTINQSSFVIEFESFYEKFFSLTKKNYYTKTIGSTEIVHKGGLGVKRNYSQVTKTIYNKVLQSIFDATANPIDIAYEELQKVYNGTYPDHEFIKSISFKDFKAYSHHMSVCYLDKNDLPISEPISPTDPRLDIRKWTPGVYVAYKNAQRKEPIPWNSRIEYVNCRLDDEKSQKYKHAEEYRHFFYHKKDLSLDKEMYIKESVNPLDQILTAAGIGRVPSPKVYSPFMLALFKRKKIKPSRRKLTTMGEAYDLFVNRFKTIKRINKKIIAFEGVDGSGKSTHARQLALDNNILYWHFPSNETTSGEIIHDHLRGRFNQVNEKKKLSLYNLLLRDKSKSEVLKIFGTIDSELNHKELCYKLLNTSNKEELYNILIKVLTEQQIYELFLRDKFEALTKIDSEIVIFDRYITSGIICAIAKDLDQSIYRNELSLPKPELTYVLSPRELRIPRDYLERDHLFQYNTSQLFNDNSYIYSTTIVRIDTSGDTQLVHEDIQSIYVKHTKS